MYMTHRRTTKKRSRPTGRQRSSLSHPNISSHSTSSWALSFLQRCGRMGTFDFLLTNLYSYLHTYNAFFNQCFHVIHGGIDASLCCRVQQGKKKCSAQLVKLQLVRLLSKFSSFRLFWDEATSFMHLSFITVQIHTNT